jgi:hypothetical protein
MLYVILGTHAAEVCPTSNAATRALMLDLGPQIPKIAEKHNVTIVSGPYVNREHLTVIITEAQHAEDVDAFLVEARLPQWNTVKILPSLTIQEAMSEIEEQPALF